MIIAMPNINWTNDLMWLQKFDTFLRMIFFVFVVQFFSRFDYLFKLNSNSFAK